MQAPVLHPMVIAQTARRSTAGLLLLLMMMMMQRCLYA
jgi:hypothetical protein